MHLERRVFLTAVLYDRGPFFCFISEKKKKPEAKMCSGFSKCMGLVGVRNSSLVLRTYGIFKVLKKKKKEKKMKEGFG